MEKYLRSPYTNTAIQNCNTATVFQERLLFGWSAVIEHNVVWVHNCIPMPSPMSSVSKHQIKCTLVLEGSITKTQTSLPLTIEHPTPMTLGWQSGPVS